MTSTALVFPHQLFQLHPALQHKPDTVVLIEHPLFFGDQRYPLRMHKQKLAFHRATMSAYQEFLEKSGVRTQLVKYVATVEPLAPLCAQLATKGCSELLVADVHDDMLSRRLRSAADTAGLSLNVLVSPGFTNRPEENHAWRKTRKRWFMADFYQWQRKRLDILLEAGKPVGGRWSFDEDNRKKLPKNRVAEIPRLPSVVKDARIQSAIDSVEKEFPANPGYLDEWYYPVSTPDAERWLDSFLKLRFSHFGSYEDAMVPGENWLYHSVLTPMLNTGLLTPDFILQKTLAYAERENVPINSVEGFVRQIIGWREFMRATYDDLGVTMRTTNHWQHQRELPDSFYDATTGIDPVDDVISRVLSTGYCHHIERLMILGGFMFLCEIHPDAIYRWFMEMFIDSYDWVMVPNVYAMSQNADGGAITTKPYFSGSNYVLKMSHYKKGDWSDIWDALFWRWIINHSDELRKNPRWAMMVRNADKMDEERRAAHLQRAEHYLASLDESLAG